MNKDSHKTLFSQVNKQSYEIDKDPLINKWVVWSVYKNYKCMVYCGKTKKQCLIYVNNKKSTENSSIGIS